MRSKANKSLVFLTGVGAGAAFMYLYDPISGRHRLRVAAGKLEHAKVALGHEVGKASRDLGHRGKGLLARAAMQLWSMIRTPAPNPDRLHARVRSELGRCVSHPRAVQVSSSDGRIILTGQVLEHEAAPLLCRIMKVRGVVDVEDRLERFTASNNVPALQGEGRTSRPVEEWSPAMRLFAGSLGAYYLLKGMRRGGFTGSVMKVAGGTVLTRAVLNMPVRRIIGVGAGYRAVDLQKTITVQAPLDDVYRFWTHIENFPRFMQHVREVTRTGETTSHWKVSGPPGKTFEWDAETTVLEEGRCFEWRTLPGTSVEHRGVIRFQDAGEFATRLDIRMSYNPPAGAIGHGLATIFRVDPKTAMDEDLQRMKALLEKGRARAHGQVVTVDELEAAAIAPPPTTEG